MDKQFGIIYTAINKKNNKMYVGKTIRSLKERIDSHFYCGKNHSGTLFHRSLYKNYNDFLWIVITECYDEKHLNECERYYIKLFDCKSPNGYNLTDGGDGTLGYNHSDGTKSQISETMINVMSRYYKLTFLDGTEKIIKNLKKYCSENKLNYNLIKSWYINTGKYYKNNFIIDRVVNNKIKNKNNINASKFYNVVMPDGIELTVKCLKLFCEENNLNLNSVRRYCKLGKKYKGYEFKKSIDK